MSTPPLSRAVAPSTLVTAHGSRAPGRGWWGGQRVLAFAIGSGGTALGIALLAIASERTPRGGSPLSAAAVVGAATLIGSLLLVARGARG